MGYVSKLQREEQRARAIVDSFALPPPLSGYKLEFGEFDGDKALWVTLELDVPDDMPRDQLRPIIRRLNGFSDEVHVALLDAFEDRYPFVRYGPPGPPA